MPDESLRCANPDCDERILLGADKGRTHCYRCETAAGQDPWRWTTVSSSEE